MKRKKKVNIDQFLTQNVKGNHRILSIFWSFILVFFMLQYAMDVI